VWEGAQEVHASFSLSLLLSGIEKSHSKLLPSRRKSANPTPGFSWHRGFAGIELSRFIPCLPLSRIGNTGGRGCGRGCTHLCRERGCLPERFCAPQAGYTPLLNAALRGHASVVEQLLAAGANTEAKDPVSWERGGGCQMRM